MANEEQVLFSIPLTRLEPIFKGWIKEVISQTLPSKRDCPADELLTIDGAAQLLSVSVPTVYGYVHAKQVPYMKRRGRLYFSKLELLEWIKASRRMTKDEIKKAAAQSLER